MSGLIDKIPYLKGYTKVVPITEGHSDAIKFLVEKDEKKYFVKIKETHISKKLNEKLCQANIPHPEIFEIGFLSSASKKQYYIIEAFLEGETLKNKMSKVDKKFIYEYGFELGEKYKNFQATNPDIEMDANQFEHFEKYVCREIDFNKNHMQTYKNQLGINYGFIVNIRNQLLHKYKMMRKCPIIYSNTDIKPSNFMIQDKKIYAIDFESTEYCNMLFAMRYGFYFNDSDTLKKSIVFLEGYLEGFYQLQIPSIIVKNLNSIFLLMLLKYVNKLLLHEEFEKLNSRLQSIQEEYFHGESMVLKNLLTFGFDLSKITMLKGFGIELQKGSYSPYNLTFKCTNNQKSYFLKAMLNNHKGRGLIGYQLLEAYNIPTVKILKKGFEEKYNRFYYVAEYKDLQECSLFMDDKSFEQGYILGKKVAQYFYRLKDVKVDNLPCFDIEKFYRDLKKNMDEIFKDKNISSIFQKYISYSKEELSQFAAQYYKAFECEPLHLIHEDIKPGNILSDGKTQVCFVDNEGLLYSYDMMNFRWNYMHCFGQKPSISFQGLVKGYLEQLNDGSIPSRIHFQIKFMLIYLMIDDTIRVKNKMKDEVCLKKYQIIMKEILNNHLIGWLET